jgi:hypothetical protein
VAPNAIQIAEDYSTVRRIRAAHPDFAHAYTSGALSEEEVRTYDEAAFRIFLATREAV